MNPHAEAVVEVNLDLMAEPQGAAQVVADRVKAFGHEPEVATRLAAAKRRALGKQVQRCPDREPVRRTAEGLHGVDAEPEAGSRQAGDLGDRLFDESRQFATRTLAHP